MAGNQRFELCNSGFGVRCSSSRACFPKNPGRGRRNRTPRILTRPPLSRRLGDHSPAPSVYSNLVPEERLALSLPNGNWVLRPARIHFATRALEHRSGLEPDKSGFAIRRLDRFGIQCLNFGWGGRTRTFDRSGQSRVQLPLCHSPAFWLRGPVSSRPLCGFRAALSPD